MLVYNARTRRSGAYDDYHAYVQYLHCRNEELNLTDYNQKYSEYQRDFENTLDKFCNGLDCKPDILNESLKYSLRLGGKRIRPVLMLSVGELLGVEREKLLNFALALELIHT
ncbi:MAG: polyprenyl synthetase family protein, partial [Clostridia bacterium]|nr:polyprenyl synthetase family protein [Clostridia bacterium]